jgi:GNAT superfamily N-acetyltransferase
MPFADVELDRVLLRDGHVVGRYHFYGGPPPAAEFFEPSEDITGSAETILEELAGWNLTTPHLSLAERLTTLGAKELRRYSVMTMDLTATPERLGVTVPAELEVRTLRPDTLLPEGIAELVRAAYPPGHPDQELGTEEQIVDDLRHALDGSRLGPLMAGSRLVLDAGRPVAVALVNRVVGHPPAGGPWLTDLFRDPDHALAGLGRALIFDVFDALRTSGETALSLAVTEGNKARRLYGSLGFETVAELRKLRLPA